MDDLTVVLPKEVATTRGIEEALFAEHARATALELSVSELKAEYLRACFRGDWWGCLWFDVWDDLRRTSRRILCISPDEIGVADVQTRAKVTAWPMRRVQRWAAPKGAVTIDFLPGEDPGAQNEVASFQVRSRPLVWVRVIERAQCGLCVPARSRLRACCVRPLCAHSSMVLWGSTDGRCGLNFGGIGGAPADWSASKASRRRPDFAQEEDALGQCRHRRRRPSRQASNAPPERQKVKGWSVSEGRGCGSGGPR